MFFIIIEYPVAVITDQSLQLEIMQSIHSGDGETKQVQSTGGHLGQNKTCEKVTKRYYWPRVTQDVTNFINSCHKCQVAKEVHLQKANTKLPSVVVPNKTWCQITLIWWSASSKDPVATKIFLCWLTTSPNGQKLFLSWQRQPKK